ncbi:hypothetical protein FJZ18_01620 [Candidatus Pacearchaeota archaeon]|nr:hypothetical protein [Candidatus Pacearchaeota archaeon]
MAYGNFQDLSNVEEYLKERIMKTKATAIIGGHYALEPEYKKECLEVRSGIDEDDAFGAFPIATFDYACRLASFARERGKQSKLVLLIDDHSLMHPRNWYAQTEEDENSKQTQEAVQRYFSSFQVPQSYQKILGKYGLAQNDLLSSKQGLPVFQESRYRVAYLKKTGVDRTCAGEFEFILDEISHAGFDNIIGYIPLRCREPTCGALVSTNFYAIQENRGRSFQGDLIYMITRNNYDSIEKFEAAHNDDNHGILLFHCGGD